MHWLWIWFDLHISMVWERNIYTIAHFMYRSGMYARPPLGNEELTRSSIGGRERFFGDWWFKRWETINVWWGVQDPAPWTAIKCRYENRTQPVLISTRRSFFSSLFRGTLGSALSFLSLCPCVIMKLVPVLLLVATIVFAAEEKKEEERPKTFRRLIPADILRGESFFSFIFLLSEIWKSLLSKHGYRYRGTCI